MFDLSHTSHFWLYFVLVAGIIALPGMDMAFVMASSLVDGRRAGAAAVAGIVAGGVIHVAMASLGVGLLLLMAVVPVVLTLVFAAPFWLASSRIKGWQALVIGFVLTNLFLVGLLVSWAYVELDWVAGILWFMLKTYVFVFTFVWMRGTLPRVRIDQLMDFAWKWLLPASLLNLFVTAAAIVVLSQLDPSGSLVPGATVPAP